MAFVRAKAFILAVPAMLFALSYVIAQPISDNLQKVEVVFDVSANSIVKQTTNFLFKNEVSGSLNYTLNGVVKDADVSDGSQKLDYNMVRNGADSVIDIFLSKPTKEVILSYTVDGVVFHSGSISHFFTEFTFDKSLESVDVKVVLPAGYKIYQGDYNPPNASIVSDGERVILTWKTPNRGDPILFSVKFTSIGQASVWFVAAAVLAGAASALYLHFRKKIKLEFLKGFREDERKTIGYLEQNRTALQSDLQSQFGFSRAKATRIVSRLEGQGLLRKQKYGRTNKLFWLK